jgi:hypothetical protein
MGKSARLESECSHKGCCGFNSRPFRWGGWHIGKSACLESRSSSKGWCGSGTQRVARSLRFGLFLNDKDILGVCRSARDFAKVADQVRFLTRMLTAGGYGVVARM